MRDFILQLLALLGVLAGTAFSILGVLGYIRLPDVYTRLHATGKVGIFGVVLLTAAAIAWTPLSLGKGLLLIGLLMLAGPVVSHAVASAALRIRIPWKRLERNDLPGGMALAEENLETPMPIGTEPASK